MSALLPTTMVGAYPRPAWYRDQLEGRDIREAFKVIHREEAFRDAVGAVIADQQSAGLDVVTDGQMWFDDYAMGIGAFFWYWFERIGGFGREKLEHPARARTAGKDAFTLDESGGVAVRGPIERGPVRLADLYAIAARAADQPVKASVGAGPLQLSTMAHFEAGPIKNRFDLSAALADVFRAEIEDLVCAGCRHVQLEDLGAWVPNVTGAARDFDWVTDTVNRLFSGVEGVERCWHFCLGNAWGSRAEGLTKGGYGGVLPRYFDVDVDAFVLDFACRDMVDIAVLRGLPADKAVHAGVIDVRNLEVEQPEQVAARIRAVLEVVAAERVTLTTDCGMKQLPRTVARAKLGSLTQGAAIVRAELEGTTPPAPGRRIPDQGNG
ncbi:MAG: 5-methyltetrahydropteroyltriglutamate--homocysteine methyltransferase [Solirubrobacteraceae bacterium]|nr:5-methyltetrahydropteroyltriglutamate--homocysteine methyltransferase [Solirubrobacteraceae bacterium]